MKKKRLAKSAMKPRLVDKEYTIFDALLETLQKKEQEESRRHGLVKRLRSPMNLAALFLMVIGSATMVWVSNLVWVDITFWEKDIALILFGSRTGEPISLGIGMAVIHYFLIGMLFLSLGLIFFIRIRIGAKKAQQAMRVEAPKVKMMQSVNVSSAVKSNGKEENGAAREAMFFSGCLHHFGHLSNRPKDSPIPQECIICQRLGDCMVATIYVKRANE